MSVADAELRGVLIDLDGTLIDTAPDIAAAANLMRAEFGLLPLAVERVAAFVGKGADLLVHRALTDSLDSRLDPVPFAAARTAFFRHYHATNGTLARVYDGVGCALAQLRMAGLRLACVTNKAREFTEPLLARLGLVRWFDVTVSADEVSAPKPDPALLFEACARLDLSPAQVVLIGDSINDALAAHAAGCRVVLVETGYNEGEDVNALRSAAGVDAIVPALPDAARYLVARVGGDQVSTPAL
ncbi:MAG TPA: phosphoglycolate phosphatase [Burkholderiaceae bacterium]|nr:phosphoglycolate phosphatase [Burkholderiaceae bacterium]